MTAPTVPVFRPGTPPASVAADLNAKVRDVFLGLLDRPRFRARRTTALALVEGAHTLVPWTAIDEDSHSGWVSGTPTRYTAPAGWGGWYEVDAGVSLSGTGAAGLVLIPSISVNGVSHTGVGGIWEGPEVFIPTGAAAEPKYVGSAWRVYASEGDYIEIDLWYSTESAIVAADITAGEECRVSLVWDGV